MASGRNDGDSGALFVVMVLGVAAVVFAPISRYGWLGVPLTLLLLVLLGLGLFWMKHPPAPGSFRRSAKPAEDATAPTGGAGSESMAAAYARWAKEGDDVSVGPPGPETDALLYERWVRSGHPFKGAEPSIHITWQRAAVQREMSRRNPAHPWLAAEADCDRPEHGHPPKPRTS